MKRLFALFALAGALALATAPAIGNDAAQAVGTAPIVLAQAPPATPAPAAASTSKNVPKHSANDRRHQRAGSMNCSSDL